MRLSSRVGALFSGVGLVAALAVLPVVAQEPAASPAQTPAAPVAKRSYDRSRRVPVYFGQLGLTPEQRETIYSLRSKHDEQISALKQQLADAQAKMLLDCEAVLTPAQKDLLVQRRRAAMEARRGASAGRLTKAANTQLPKPGD